MTENLAGRDTASSSPPRGGGVLGYVAEVEQLAPFAGSDADAPWSAGPGPAPAAGAESVAGAGRPAGVDSLAGAQHGAVAPPHPAPTPAPVAMPDAPGHGQSGQQGSSVPVPEPAAPSFDDGDTVEFVLLPDAVAAAGGQHGRRRLRLAGISTMALAVLAGAGLGWTVLGRGGSSNAAPPPAVLPSTAPEPPGFSTGARPGAAPLTGPSTSAPADSAPADSAPADSVPADSAPAAPAATTSARSSAAGPSAGTSAASGRAGGGNQQDVGLPAPGGSGAQQGGGTPPTSGGRQSAPPPTGGLQSGPPAGGGDVPAGGLSAIVSRDGVALPAGVGGFPALVRLDNSGAAPVADWTVTLTFTGEVRIRGVRGARHDGDGSTIVFRPSPKAGPVPANGAVTFSFRVEGLRTATPTGCTVGDGAPCRLEGLRGVL